MEPGSGAMSEGQASQGKSRGDLAWLPDLAEANNTSDDGALNAFEPIEPDAHVFVTHPEAGQQIVSGGRGMGKSTLLIYRMRRLRNMRKSFKLVRTTARLGWRLKTNGIAVPTGSLAYLSQPSNWTAIWLTILELLFAYAIAREDIGTRADKLDEWKALFGASKDDDLFLEVLTALYQMGSNPHEERLHELIQPLIRANVPPHTLATWRARYVQPVLDRRRGKDASEPTRWFLYVDCIDETLCHEDSDPARTRRGIMNRGTAERFTVPTGELGARGISRENARSLVYELWIAAQVGYALAAHDLRQRTGALIALGSFRSETLDRFKLEVDLLDGKLKGFLHELDHDEDLLRKIFQYNAIDLMDDKTSSERAVGTDRHTKACVRLCGHERIFNRSVFGVEEDVFSLIRRHNFGTPRGLMLLGGAVRDVPLLGGPGGRTRDPSAVVEAVNKAAVQVFLEYRNTLFPSWDGDYELGESLIDSNVITKSDAVKLEAAFEARLDEGQRRGGPEESPTGKVKLLTYLKSVGLVGVPRMLGDDVVQHFWLPGHDVADSDDDADYFIVHPAYAAYIRSRLSTAKQVAFYRSNFLANPGGPCPATWRAPRVKLQIAARQDGANIVCTIAGRSEPVFTGATKVGSVFLVALIVAHAHWRTAKPMGKKQLVPVADALRQMGILPEDVGKPLKTPERLVSSACDNYEHAEESNQATCVKAAKALLTRSDLAIEDVYRLPVDGGNAFALTFEGERISSEDIQVSGLKPLRLSELVAKVQGAGPSLKQSTGV